MTEARLPAARPVAQWESIGQPVALATALWNHAATMRAEFAKRNLKWPVLTSQDLTDLLVYLRNLPPMRAASTRVEISSGADGEALFRSKGCEGCHTGRLALASRFQGKTLTDIAAAMWNHQPLMTSAAAAFTPLEMGEVTSYLWAVQFFQNAGDPGAGRRVFTSKRCVACHEDAASGAPKLGGKALSAAAMVAALWRHGPQMLNQMKTGNIPWPHFEGAQMSNLIAFLNARN